MITAEKKRWFNVAITNKAGETVKIPQLACSKWHAIELVYGRLCSEQPDRTKYKVLKKGLN